MNRRITASVLFLFAVFFGVAAAQAPTTVTPDNGQDEIVQFNNLRITEIVSTSEIRAVTNYDYPNPCIKFESPNSSSGVSFPCPMMGRPDFIYTIKVSPQTILLLRNRARANFSDFEVNNRINVYGFYDSSTNTLDALIMRNISKPKERKFIQLNNLEVVNISSGTLPATITAVQNFSYPCFEYGMMGSGPAKSMPCPMGMSASSGMMMDVQFPPGSFRKYSIEVKANSSILDRNRNSMEFGKIAKGDKINVYGLYDEDTQGIESLILRDLSKPSQKENISGTITSVNPDGSFVIRSDSGEEFTVKPSVAVGLRVEVEGFVDRAARIISDIVRLLIKR
ncbi:hypothetical protein HYT00_02310 [Candidatus Giovannonibacteria bacterium]|nr:hypothetical protein [Candidatus Giovannonibacteria bacterium]